MLFLNLAARSLVLDNEMHLQGFYSRLREACLSPPDLHFSSFGPTEIMPVHINTVSKV